MPNFLGGSLFYVVVWGILRFNLIPCFKSSTITPCLNTSSEKSFHPDRSACHPYIISKVKNIFIGKRDFREATLWVNVREILVVKYLPYLSLSYLYLPYLIFTYLGLPKKARKPWKHWLLMHQVCIRSVLAKSMSSIKTEQNETEW